VSLSAAPSSEVSRRWQLCHSYSFNWSTSYVLFYTGALPEPAVPPNCAARHAEAFAQSVNLFPAGTGAYLLRQAWPKTCWGPPFPPLPTSPLDSSCFPTVSSYPLSCSSRNSRLPLPSLSSLLFARLLLWRPHDLSPSPFALRLPSRQRDGPFPIFHQCGL
jgi:hypothetical protein